jgi:hypothetical protein
VDTDAIERKSIARRKAGFEKWLNDPMVIMCISMVSGRETLRMLLQSAFESGFSYGGSDMMSIMVDALLTKPAAQRS